jgi:hypothetical protein
VNALDFHQLLPVTLSTAVRGNGTIKGVATGGEVFATGSRVYMVPVAASGSYFVKWVGDAIAGLDGITVIMDTDKSLEAVFAEYIHLDIVQEGNGTIQTDTDPDRLIPGSTINLEVTPAPGWYFEEWTGDAIGAETRLSLVMDEGKTVTGTFNRTHLGFLQSFFTEEERALPAISGLDADPDFDGLTNQEEFVFDLNPRSKDPPPLHLVSSDGANLLLTYPHSRFLDGWTLQVTGSKDLVTWNIENVNSTILRSGPVFDYVKARLPVANDQPAFLRLEIIPPETSSSGQ